MAAEIHKLPASAHMSVEQAIDSVKRDFNDAKDVLVAMWDADGHLAIRSSHMSRQDALWLLEKAKAWALAEDA